MSLMPAVDSATHPPEGLGYGAEQQPQPQPQSSPASGWGDASFAALQHASSQGWEMPQGTLETATQLALIAETEAGQARWDELTLVNGLRMVTAVVINGTREPGRGESLHQYMQGLVMGNPLSPSEAAPALKIGGVDARVKDGRIGQELLDGKMNDLLADSISPFARRMGSGNLARSIKTGEDGGGPIPYIAALAALGVRQFSHSELPGSVTRQPAREMGQMAAANMVQLALSARVIGSSLTEIVEVAMLERIQTAPDSGEDSAPPPAIAAVIGRAASR